MEYGVNKLEWLIGVRGNETIIYTRIILLVSVLSLPAEAHFNLSI